jgi:hypothetical protein
MSHAQKHALALFHEVEDVRPELAEDLAAGAPGLDEAGGLEAADVPADQRLAEADRVDEVADGGRALDQAANDAQPVHIGQSLVEDPKLAQIVGLIDDRGDGAADVRGGRQAGGLSILLQTSLYIKAG